MEYNQLRVPIPNRRFRFDLFPLDAHDCSLIMYSVYDMRSIKFSPMEHHFNNSQRITILEYDVAIRPLSRSRNHFYDAGVSGNFSITGLEFRLVR
jgi:hypothetical protein